jgi:predicted AAA+ superfamily ATPase
MGETKLVRPHYWTQKQDLIISELFDFVSTEKLSILMQVKTQSIVERKQYLENIKNDSELTNKKMEALPVRRGRPLTKNGRSVQSLL